MQEVACVSVGDKGMLPAGCVSHLDVSRASAEAMLKAFDAFAVLGNRHLEAQAASLYAHVRLDAVWWTHVLQNKAWEAPLIATAPKEPNNHALAQPLLGTQFTCCTGTKLKMLRSRFGST